METGRTVILLNLESLYESLYDALNQVCIVFHCVYSAEHSRSLQNMLMRNLTAVDEEKLIKVIF